MKNTAALPRPELLQVAEAVARDKGIEKDEVLTAMEAAIQKAGRSKYGTDVYVRIDRKTGEILAYPIYEVIADDAGDADIEDNGKKKMPLREARKIDSNVNVGDDVIDDREDSLSIDFGRIPAQTAKQVIGQKIRDAERIRQYNEYKDRVGEIINGIVKRIETGSVIVDIGRAEAVLRWDEMIRRETFRTGDRIRAYIMDVRLETRGPQIFLSRTHPQFLAKLFAQEVPEIYDGVIEIKAVARDPGSRAKMAVTATDSSIDPVGACVGMRGVRVQAVVNELQGEKIDIIQWSSDPATFIVNALAPAEVVKVVLDEEDHRMEVVVPDDQKSLAIGGRGQNVRLASQLTGWYVDILTEAEESERRQSEVKVRTQAFIDALDVDDVIAHLLVAEGFNSVDEIAVVPMEEIASIEGFDEDLATELQNRAKAYIEKRNAEFAVRSKELGVDDSLMGLDGLTQEMIVKLAEKGVKTLDDFADLATDEVLEIVGENAMTAHDAEALIMKAREHWFENDGEKA